MNVRTVTDSILLKFFRRRSIWAKLWVHFRNPKSFSTTLKNSFSAPPRKSCLERQADLRFWRDLWDLKGFWQTFQAENRLSWIDERWMARSEFTAAFLRSQKQTWCVHTILCYIHFYVHVLRSFESMGFWGLTIWPTMLAFSSSCTQVASGHQWHGLRSGCTGTTWTVDSTLSSAMAVGIRNIFWKTQLVSKVSFSMLVEEGQHS